MSAIDEIIKSNGVEVTELSAPEELDDGLLRCRVRIASNHAQMDYSIVRELRHCSDSDIVEAAVFDAWEVATAKSFEDWAVDQGIETEALPSARERFAQMQAVAPLVYEVFGGRQAFESLVMTL
ncbi:hypothetical protein [Gordonia sihwensis]|uniref:hypothetical protein n=1 Tax=Gordonia sihwensis TaxID=173559 RepID=UPI003D991870